MQLIEKKKVALRKRRIEVIKANIKRSSIELRKKRSSRGKEQKDKIKDKAQ